MASHHPASDPASKPPEDPAVQQAYLLLARRLWQQDRPLLGLLPVPAGVALGDASMRLGRAMAALGVRVALVDAPARWDEAPSGAPPLVSSLGENVDRITPTRAPRSSRGNIIEQTLSSIRGQYSCVLCDLSGLELIEAREVSFLPEMSLVLFVARGKIGEFALTRLRRKLPERHLMGAVLMDVDLPSDVSAT